MLGSKISPILSIDTACMCFSFCLLLIFNISSINANLFEMEWVFLSIFSCKTRTNQRNDNKKRPKRGYFIVDCYSIYFRSITTHLMCTHICSHTYVHFSWCARVPNWHLEWFGSLIPLTICVLPMLSSIGCQTKPNQTKQVSHIFMYLSVCLLLEIQPSSHFLNIWNVCHSEIGNKTSTTIIAKSLQLSINIGS